MEIRCQTGLRGLAAVLVAVAHLPFYLFLGGTWRNYLTEHQYVDLFFLLSGFIIAYVYVPVGGRKEINWFDFGVARVARIYPLHVVTMVLMGVGILGAAAVKVDTGADHSIVEIVPQLLMVHAYPVVGGHRMAWNFPAWSLSAEFFCYFLIFPLLFRWVCLKPKSPRFLVGGMILTMAINLGYLIFIHPKEVTPTTGITALVRGAAGFCTGALIYQWTASADRRSVDFFVKHANLILALNLVLAIAVVRWGFSLWWQLAGYPFLILALSRDSDTVTHRFFASKLMYWLGLLSFSIYMIHAFFEKTLRHLLVNKIITIQAHGLSAWLAGAGMLAGIVLVSACSYYFFELPVRRWIRSKVGNRHHKTPAAELSVSSKG